MEFTIVGAGAIGGTVGAYLARSGHTVQMVDIAQEHVDILNQQGLTITGLEDFTVPVTACTPGELEGSLECVILAVKSHHTAQALTPIVPHLAEDGTIISMQNGLNEEIIASQVGEERTLGSFVNFGADYLEPGRILFGGKGAVYLGELDGSTTPRLEKLHAIIKEAFLDNTTMTSNIWGYLWGKLGYGAQLFATALADETIADLLAIHEFRPMFVNLAAEVSAVAREQGVTPEAFDGYNPLLYEFGNRDQQAIDDSFEAMVAHNRKSKKAKSGIWRDLAVRHRPTEVEGQLTPVARRGQEFGIATPLVEQTAAFIKEIEAGAPMTIDYLCRLRDLDRETYGDSPQAKKADAHAS